jgi:hypothetical protein
VHFILEARDWPTKLSGQPVSIKHAGTHIWPHYGLGGGGSAPAKQLPQPAQARHLSHEKKKKLTNIALTANGPEARGDKGFAAWPHP